MPKNELTKREKALCRELIERGLQIECNDFLNKVRSKVDVVDDSMPHKRYLDLYKMVRDFDKLIDRRYGKATGSHYLDIVTSLYVDEIISDEDISGFEEENRSHIRTWKMLIDERYGNPSN